MRRLGNSRRGFFAAVASLFAVAIGRSKEEALPEWPKLWRVEKDGNRTRMHMKDLLKGDCCEIMHRGGEHYIVGPIQEDPRIDPVTGFWEVLHDGGDQHWLRKPPSK
jgi:hypothetical protein